MSRRDLEDRLIETIEPTVHTIPIGGFDWDNGVHVGEYDVGIASRCQAAAASPPGEFSPTVFTAYKTVARGAVRAVAANGGVRPALMSHVRAARGPDREIDKWIRDFLSDCDQPTLVETVQRAATWLHRSAAVLGDADLARHGPSRKVEWDHPERALRLKATVDLIADDDNAAVFVVPQIDDARLDQIAYASVLYLLNTKAAPDVVRIAAHSTGELVEMSIDDLIPRALPATARAVAALAQRGEPAGLHRSPSYFTCRDCPWAESCDVRVVSEARRPRIRQGIRFPD